eukprot:scpid51641/ scgid24887/ Probable proline--tRNA ligase, mitochondrial; Prolyl-tRNA synthetase
MFRRGISLSSTLYPRAGFSYVSEEKSANHFRGLFRGGLVRPGSSPGTVAMMPLGQRVVDKVMCLIEAQMSGVNAHKINLPILTADSIMQESGRWDEFGNSLFRVKDHSGRFSCLGPTHEEAISNLVGCNAKPSYHDLPIRMYQIGAKFRDESHTGLLRTREFLMKDLYCFDINTAKAEVTFGQVCDAYNRIFRALELPFRQVDGDVGLMGGQLSSEFQSISEAGQDTVFLCSTCGKAWNSEMADSQGHCSDECQIEEKKTIEIGHAFLLGDRYSKQFNAVYTSPEDTQEPCVMSCYGIGISRVLAAIIEAHWSDEKNYLVWPKAFAPHSISVLSLGKPREERLEKARTVAETLCRSLCTATSSGHSHLQCGSDILLDDRLWWPDGMRLKEAELLGSPYLVVAGKKSNEGLYELQHQPSRERELHSLDALVERLRELLAKDQELPPATAPADL